MPKTKSRWARSLGRGIRNAFQAVDKTAGRIANRPMKQVRHGRLEWTKDEDGKPVHVGGSNGGFPTAPRRRPVKWSAAHTHADKEVWRATFDTGVSLDFTTWPCSRRELEEKAHQVREEKYGVYSADWPLNDLTLLHTLGGDETEDEDE